MSLVPDTISLSPPPGMEMIEVLDYYMAGAPSGAALEREWHRLRAHAPRLFCLPSTTDTNNDDDDVDDHVNVDDDNSGGGNEDATTTAAQRPPVAASSSVSDDDDDDDSRALCDMDMQRLCLYFLIVGAKDTLLRTRTFFLQYLQVDKLRHQRAARVLRRAQQEQQQEQEQEQQQQQQQEQSSCDGTATTHAHARALARQAHNRVVAHVSDAYTRTAEALRMHFTTLCAHVLWPRDVVQHTLVAQYVLRLNNAIRRYSPLPVCIADEYARAQSAQYRRLYTQWVAHAAQHEHNYADYLVERHRACHCHHDDDSHNRNSIGDDNDDDAAYRARLPPCHDRGDCKQLVRQLAQYMTNAHRSSSSGNNDDKHDATTTTTAACAWVARVLDVHHAHAWLPCEVIADRVSFNTGYVRVTPRYDARVLRLLLRWMHVAATELPDARDALARANDRHQHHHHHSSSAAATQHDDDDDDDDSSSTSAGDDDDDHDACVHDTDSRPRHDDTDGDAASVARARPRAYAALADDAAAALLTVLSPSGRVVELQLTNPLLIPTAPDSSYDCDACCCGHIHVSYQAILHTDVRDRTSVYQDSVGYDVCIACAVHLYASAVRRLLRALHPCASWRRPFAYGAHVQMRVWSVSVSSATLVTASCNNNNNNTNNNSSSGSSDDEAVAHDEAVMMVHMYVGVAPAELCVVAWQLPPSRLRRLSRVPCGIDEHDTRPLTAAMWRALPLPPRPRSTTTTTTKAAHDDADVTCCRVTRVRSHYGCSSSSSDEKSEAAGATANAALPLFGADDECVICLQPLAGPTPTLQTRCQHWFHVNCLHKLSNLQAPPPRLRGSGGASAASTVADVACPVCRCMPCLPATALTSEELVRSNVYRVDLRVRCRVARTVDAAAVHDDGVVVLAQHVAVAALLSPDGVYHNPTNVAACQAFVLQPQQLCAYDEQRGRAARRDTVDQGAQ